MESDGVYLDRSALRLPRCILANGPHGPVLRLVYDEPRSTLLWRYGCTIPALLLFTVVLLMFPSGFIIGSLLSETTPVIAKVMIALFGLALLLVGLVCLAVVLVMAILFFMSMLKKPIHGHLIQRHGASWTVQRFLGPKKNMEYQGSESFTLRVIDHDRTTIPGHPPQSEAACVLQGPAEITLFAWAADHRWLQAFSDVAEHLHRIGFPLKIDSPAGVRVPQLHNNRTIDYAEIVRGMEANLADLNLERDDLAVAVELRQLTARPDMVFLVFPLGGLLFPAITFGAGGVEGMLKWFLGAGMPLIFAAIGLGLWYQGWQVSHYHLKLLLDQQGMNIQEVLRNGKTLWHQAPWHLLNDIRIDQQYDENHNPHGHVLRIELQGGRVIEVGQRYLACDLQPIVDLVARVHASITNH